MFRKLSPFDHSSWGELGVPGKLSYANLLAWQSLLKQCQIEDLGKWRSLATKYRQLDNVSDIFLSPELFIGFAVPTTIRMFCDGIKQAVLAAIFLDKLEQVRSSMCQREHCHTVFNHSSGHKRKYCTYDCAHYVAGKDYNSRKAKKNVDL